MAADQGRLKLLQKVWEWANEKLTAEEINNKLLLATDNKGRNVLYMAADLGRPEILQKVSEWAKKKLTPQEINNNLLLAIEGEGRIIWHVTGEWGKPEIQWMPLIVITLGLALFDNNNQLIILSGRYKNLHYLTQFIVTVQPPGKPVSTPELPVAPLSTNTVQ